MPFSLKALSARLIVALIGAIASCGLSVCSAQQRLPRPPRMTALQTSDPFRDDRLGLELIPTAGTAGTLDRLHEPLLRRDLTIDSAQSCAAASCHGGPHPGVLRPAVRRGAAYQLWKENDPHSRSWRTICSSESIAMMRRLNILDENRIIDRQGFDNCLACHNSTARFDEPRTDATIHEGVGCTACHGPSQQWIHSHYRRDWSPISAEPDGFVAAGDLYVRARMCASCHVGDKDRDMNHDMIAAGHPTLRYELATFHAWQPKHWRDQEAADRQYYEAQLWLAGQIASTDASLSLLSARAGRGHSVSQWPEFAAYDCASCHHHLGLDNQRDPLGPKRKATAIYSQWNDSGLRWLLNYRRQSGIATDQDMELLQALDQVALLMQVTPRPDDQAVEAACITARKRLASWFDSAAGIYERSNFGSDRLGQVVASAAGDPDTYATWESAVQFYLAAVAARESWPGGWHGPLYGIARQMQSGLRYPQMIDISRYAKRSTASGPTASRLETIQWGIELAGNLGPVRWTGDSIANMQSPDDATLEAQLQETLSRLEQKWPDQQAVPRPPQGVPPPPKVNERPAVQPPKRESIEDIRRSIEALQSGRSDPEPEGNR